VSLAIGVDVAARRGCDVVALGDDLVARPAGRVFRGSELRLMLNQLQPDVVAIDAPPAWAPDGERRDCETQLTARGVCLFTTPDRARGTSNAFYGWMQIGFELFDGARGFPSFETFPHATAVAIRGHLPAAGLLRRRSAKKEWRLDALREAGVDVTNLRTLDEVDAALCAYAGRAWTLQRGITIGDPVQGQMLLPVVEIPDHYVKRSETTSSMP
jgi:predicted nuclease with RNAse H fold